MKTKPGDMIEARAAPFEDAIPPYVYVTGVEHEDGAVFAFTILEDGERIDSFLFPEEVVRVLSPKEKEEVEALWLRRQMLSSGTG